MRKRSFWANKITALVLAIATLVLCAAGCARTKGGDGRETQPDVTNTAQAQDTADTATDTVEFTDALGREVCVKKFPERTAALIGSFADLWQLAGGEVCASADDAWDDLGLDMGNAVNIGKTKDPSLELILSSDPDFVIASASTAANVNLRDSLEGAGLTVAYFDVSGFSDYLEMLDICTDITGRKDLYEKNGAAVSRQIEEAKGQLPAPSEEKKTYLFLRASAGYIRAKGSEGTVLGEMLSELGFVNIADMDSSLLENLSVETVMQYDPYRIFIVQSGDDGQAAMENVSNMINENPAWNGLGAVRGGRMYYPDKMLFSFKPNARWGEAYETLIKMLTE